MKVFLLLVCAGCCVLGTFGDKCTSGETCPSQTTCCKMASGKYGCCPMPSAVCCSDKIHCCPSGSTCDVEKGTCQKKDTVLRFLSHNQAPNMVEFPGSKIAAVEPDADSEFRVSQTERGLPMAEFRAQGIECPDGETECPDSNTCCKLKDGSYGCCEGVDAVCCSDGVHCCPHGTTCDMAQQACKSPSKGLTFTWVDKKPVRARPIPHVAKNLTCDARTTCMENDTCCNATKGQACCPLAHATCCSDKQHCCPAGTKCDVVHGRCFRAEDDFAVPWVERRGPSDSAQAEQVSKSSDVVGKNGGVMCPDGKMCSDGQTCCMLKDGSYGCCPYPDVGSDPTSTENKLSVLSALGIDCPDGSQCATGNTCCRMRGSRRYGCCPLPQAVCCSDGEHCCPSGYKCNLSKHTCEGGGISVAMVEKLPAVQRPELTKVSVSVVCPDHQSQCRDGQTCCQLQDKSYGCCNHPNAVCCSDGVHCCPATYTCNLAKGTCDKEEYSVPMTKKTPALSGLEMVKPSASIVCPGGQIQCPDGQTCCKLSTGEYGCCPLPNAVCCSDGVHCCPEGTTCDVSAGKCMKGSDSVSWLEKLTAVQRVETEKLSASVICPDGRSECQTGQTCCKLSSGQYGCCPIPNAVCCSDGVHCCPEGTTCDVSAGKCMKGSDSVSWLEKLTAVQRVETEKLSASVICPDGRSECQTGQTCCKLSSGQYGCCPIPNAVCCSDGKHCCPEGTTCDVSAGKCIKGSDSVSWLEKLTAVQRVETEKLSASVICPDGRSECQTGQTCCKLSSGQYGCCPIPNAVCCSDGVHCCPEGTTCDVSAGKCMKGSDSVSWLEKLTAVQRVETEKLSASVICPDGRSECQTGQTCCKLSSGQYGCCPIPNAVCCNDGRHCCPEGTTCDVGAGKCIQGTDSVTLLEKLTAVQRVNNVICPDKKSECMDGQTCCPLSSGNYGCCPKPNAVCCADKLHCCPSGFKCDPTTGQCSAGLVAIPWEMKQPALPRFP